MSIRIIAPDRFVKQPWKNGGGTTLELLRYPEGSTDYSVRLSIADVNSSGPFSTFSGYRRAICQLAGPAMHLRHPDLGAEKKLVAGEPYFFSGDWATECQVTGPVRDFNVIWNSGRVNCEVEFISSDQERVLGVAAGDTAFFFVQKGSLEVEEKDATARTVAAQHMMIVERIASKAVVRLAADSAVFIVRLVLNTPENCGVV